MIQLIPTIYVKQGQAISNYANGKFITLNSTPLEIAIKLKEEGFKKIEVIDIEGVETDEIENIESLKQISAYTGLEVYFGGGVNTDDEVRLAFEYGASLVICSSIAVKRRDLFEGWLLTYTRNKLVLGVDVLNNQLYTHGAKVDENIDVLDYIEHFYKLGILHVKINSLNSNEPNLVLINKVKNRFPDLKLIVTGGVNSVNEISQLNELGIHQATIDVDIEKMNFNRTNLKAFL